MKLSDLTNAPARDATAAASLGLIGAGSFLLWGGGVSLLVVGGLVFALCVAGAVLEALR